MATQDILCGSVRDQYFTGGAAWAMPPNVQPATLRYARAFSYDITVPNDWYYVYLVLVEPNATAARQRLFMVTINGQATAPIDVFALAGAANVPYTLVLQALAGAGFVRLQFQGIAGNAIVSEIIIAPVLNFQGAIVTNPPLTIE